MARRRVEDDLADELVVVAGGRRRRAGGGVVPLHLEREAKVMHTNEVKIGRLRFAPWFQVWSKPEYSSSSSSSETSPTCPIVPWDPASMTPLKVKVKTGKK